MTNEPVSFPEPSDSDNAELLAVYERKTSPETGNAPAVQTAVCMLLCGALFAAHLFFPDTADPLCQHIAKLASSPGNIFQNPIDFLAGLLHI